MNNANKAPYILMVTAAIVVIGAMNLSRAGLFTPSNDSTAAVGDSGSIILARATPVVVPSISPTPTEVPPTNSAGAEVIINHYTYDKYSKITTVNCQVNCTSKIEEHTVYDIPHPEAYADSEYVTFTDPTGKQFPFEDKAVASFKHIGDPKQECHNLPETFSWTYDYRKNPPVKNIGCIGNVTDAYSMPKKTGPIEGISSASYTAPHYYTDPDTGVRSLVATENVSRSFNSSSVLLFWGGTIGQKYDIMIQYGAKTDTFDHYDSDAGTPIFTEDDIDCDNIWINGEISTINLGVPTSDSDDPIHCKKIITLVAEAQPQVIPVTPLLGGNGVSSYTYEVSTVDSPVISKSDEPSQASEESQKSALLTIPNIPVTLLTLTPGSKGINVVTLQSYLIKNGYLAADNNTGYYGPLTTAAVAKYKADLKKQSVAVPSPISVPIQIPSYSPTPTMTQTSSYSPIPTYSASPIPRISSTPTPSVSYSPSPSVSQTSAVSLTPAPSVTVMPISSPSPLPSHSPSPTPSSSASPSPTPVSMSGTNLTSAIINAVSIMRFLTGGR